MAGIVEVIKYEGDNTTFVWKSPIEDFNTGSQLIVHESQEALFFMNGQALDLFGPGRHTLETQNIPLLGRLLNLPSNKKNPFHCEIYFINKTEQMSIKWGTDSQVQYIDPTYNYPLKIGASGEMSLRVEDARKLMIKIVGTERNLGQAQLIAKFRAVLMTKVKPHLAQTMRSGVVSIFDADSHLEVLSEALYQKLQDDFMEYGLALERFFVTTIARPEDDTSYKEFDSLFKAKAFDNERLRKAKVRQEEVSIESDTKSISMIKLAEAQAAATLKESEALAIKRQMEGYSYQQEQSFEVAKMAARNTGAGNFSSAGIGLGMMTGMANGLGATVTGITNTVMASANQAPANEAQQTAPKAEVDEMEVLKRKIEKLKLMRENGLINDEEMEVERKKLLSSL